MLFRVFAASRGGGGGCAGGCARAAQDAPQERFLLAPARPPGLRDPDLLGLLVEERDDLSGGQLPPAVPHGWKVLDPRRQVRGLVVGRG